MIRLGADTMPATEISAQAPSRLMQDAVRAGASPANPAFNQPRYKVWDGRNKFFCGGRIVAGPEPAPVVVTSLMIIGPVLVSLIQTNEWVNTELDNPASTIIMIVLAVWSLVELWMTALSDPGIIPRVDKFTRRKLGYLHRRLPPDVQTVFASGRHTTLKHCTICELFKPPRAEHCPVCDNCVMQFDHHCPWVGNCIGKRNYPRFFRFLLVVSLLNSLVIAMGMAHTITALRDNESLSSYLASLLLAVYAGGTSFFTFGMFGYHVYLTCIGMTTYEHLFVRHYRAVGSTLPRSCCRELAYMFCRVPQTFFHPRRMLADHSAFHDVDAAFAAADRPSGRLPQPSDTDSDSSDDGSQHTSHQPMPGGGDDQSWRKPDSDGSDCDDPMLEAMARQGTFSDNESDGPASSRQLPAVSSMRQVRPSTPAFAAADEEFVPDNASAEEGGAASVGSSPEPSAAPPHSDGENRPTSTPGADPGPDTDGVPAAS